MALRAFNILSICSGIGGLDLGISLAMPTAHTICYIERQAYCAADLVARMEDQALDDAPIWSDVATFDGAPWRGLVDCIIGGIPCQPHSVAGKRRGQEDERWLWDAVLRIIDDTAAPALFFENVPALRTSGLEQILQDLASRGFDAEWDVFSASSVGAPHKRERLFLAARALSGTAGAALGEPAERGVLDEAVGWHTIAQDVGGRVADTDGYRLQVFGERIADDREWSSRVRARDAYRRRCSPWPPPSTTSFDEWPLDVPTPTVTGIRRGSDGAAAWVERVHALGNAVVPEQVALAWRVLWSRML